MWAEAATALVAFADPYRMGMLMIGLLAGGIIGMMPGLGGIGAVSILLPFALTLDPFSGLAVLIGATGVVYTSDTISAILFGTPTSASSGPTAIEGFALARRGEAGRALGGAFLASMIGGLIGAVVLTLAIPIAGPLVLALGTGELLMLAIMGLAYASGLVGDSPIKGLLSAAIGLFLGTVGVAPSAPELRFTFGFPYLLDGFALTILALGLFGVAEVIIMLGQGGAIAQQQFKLTGWADGARDVIRHWKVVVMGSFIGVIFGVIPAVGASASTWIAYGQAVASAKDKSMTGKGDPRGMLAAEGANNATITTDLVPTLLFAVPGGPAAAVFLGALFVYGYFPGPRFVQMNLDLMFLIVWSSALAAILGAALCFLASPWIARLTRVDFGLVAAPLIAVILLGSFEAKKNVLDFYALFGFGVFGWLMKRAQWPRAPLLVGFVLAEPIERNFWLAYQLHGWTWLKSPIVIALIGVVILHVALTFRRALAARKLATAADQPVREKTSLTPDIGLLLAAAATGLFGAAILMSFDLAFDSRLVPLLAAVPGLIAALAVATSRLRGDTAPVAWPPRREATQLALLGCGIAAIPLTGFLPALGGYLTVMLWTCSTLRFLIVPYVAVIVAAAYGLSRAFNIPVP
ncbi:MAG TPA: tripartite tricarboxylate transporter permease [Xanthobacteraceae bacterium]|nr:tripartite tricarboxylate transporter permease [Xanthobacteraceae bacterium]